jgi:hypothetical protein
VQRVLDQLSHSQQALSAHQDHWACFACWYVCSDTSSVVKHGQSCHVIDGKTSVAAQLAQDMQEEDPWADDQPKRRKGKKGKRK